MLLEVFLKTAAAPAVAVGILLLLFGSAPEPWRSRIQAMIIGLGFFAAAYLLNGQPAWPPPGGAGTLIWVGLWFALFPWIAPPTSRLRSFFRGTWIIVGVVLAVWPLRIAIMNSALEARNILALVCIGWGMWLALERGLRHSKPLTVVSMGMITFTAASILFLLKSSLLMSQLMTAMAVIAGGLAVMAWFFPKRLSLYAVFPFLSGFLAVVMVVGYVFMDIDPWLLTSFAIPFLALLAKDLFNWTSTSSLTDALVSIAISATPLAYILYQVSKTSGPLY